jgi:hypothetical protein
MVLVVFIALFCFFLRLSKFEFGEFDFRQTACWAGGKREGPYPRGGIGYLWLTHPFC